MSLLLLLRNHEDTAAPTPTIPRTGGAVRPRRRVKRTSGVITTDIGFTAERSVFAVADEDDEYLSI